MKKAKDTTSQNSLPPIPAGFGLPFYYATLFNIEVAFLVDHKRVLPYLENTGLIAADFEGKAIVSFNFQNYNGQFPNGSSNTQEIELNKAESNKRVKLTYGASSHPIKKDMEKLIGNTPAFAVRTSMSAPAAIQTRAYYA